MHLDRCLRTGARTGYQLIGMALFQGDRGESDLTVFNAAADAALALGRRLDRVNDTARALIDWAAKAMHD